MIYGYIRVSTDKQTVENQRFEIENYCAKNNMKIDEWIFETISGKEEFEKRKLGKLLKHIKKDDTLICSELSRTMFSMISVLEICEKKCVNIIAIKENYAPKVNNSSKYLAPIFAIVSEIERDMISQRTRESLARLKANGVKLGRPIGSKSRQKKLSGKERIIEEMLCDNVPIKVMARKLKVHRKTLKNFIKAGWVSEK